MLDFAKRYGKNIYSQNGEDGIIEECLTRIDIERGYCAEWGAADGYYCSNTRKLVNEGWTGLFLEAANGQWVSPNTVNQLVPANVDLISIDTDGANDYYTWRVYKGNPAIVIIEINSSYEPLTDRIEEGSNYSVTVKLGLEKDYFLLCHTGNLIFIKNMYRSLFPEVVGDGLSNWRQYFNTSWQHDNIRPTG